MTQLSCCRERDGCRFLAFVLSGGMSCNLGWEGEKAGCGFILLPWTVRSEVTLW